MSAAVFLENADAAALTISPLEFERAIERCKELAELQTKKMEGAKRAIFTFHSTSSKDDLKESDVTNTDGVFSNGSDDRGNQENDNDGGGEYGKVFQETKNIKEESTMKLLPALSIHDVRKGKSHMTTRYS